MIQTQSDISNFIYKQIKQISTLQFQQSWILLLTFKFNFFITKNLNLMSSLNKNSQISQGQTISGIPLLCAFHKDKAITNFCNNYSCLLPMCPSCISIHSQEHRQQNTHGQFLSIQQVIQSISSLLLKTNKSLQELSQQYTEDYWNKQKIMQHCKQILSVNKKKLIKQIERKFEEIEYKMTRKINQFQDNVHDRYKQLQSEIQYLYESLNKQREDFISSNQKVLKNIICFYSQKKEEKIKDWLNKFRMDVNDLKRQSIRIKCNDELFDLVKSIDYFFSIEQFRDDQNQYLISTGRQLISSNTKRKGTQSPRWTQDKQNVFTVRTNINKNNNNANRSPINQLSQANIFNSKNQVQWSASKF